MSTVWKATVDQGTYECIVEDLGTDDKQPDAVLRVREVGTGKIILQTWTGLSYGAIFGPDVADVQEWKELSMNAIEDYEAGLID